MHTWKDRRFGEDARSVGGHVPPRPSLKRGRPFKSFTRCFLSGVKAPKRPGRYKRSRKAHPSPLAVALLRGTAPQVASGRSTGRDPIRVLPAPTLGSTAGAQRATPTQLSPRPAPSDDSITYPPIPVGGRGRDGGGTRQLGYLPPPPRLQSPRPPRCGPFPRSNPRPSRLRPPSPQRLNTMHLVRLFFLPPPSLLRPQPRRGDREGDAGEEDGRAVSARHPRLTADCEGLTAEAEVGATPRARPRPRRSRASAPREGRRAGSCPGAAPPASPAGARPADGSPPASRPEPTATPPPAALTRAPDFGRAPAVLSLRAAVARVHSPGRAAHPCRGGPALRSPAPLTSRAVCRATRV